MATNLRSISGQVLLIGVFIVFSVQGLHRFITRSNPSILMTNQDVLAQIRSIPGTLPSFPTPAASTGRPPPTESAISGDDVEKLVYQTAVKKAHRLGSIQEVRVSAKFLIVSSVWFESSDVAGCLNPLLMLRLWSLDLVLRRMSLANDSGVSGYLRRRFHSSWRQSPGCCCLFARDLVTQFAVLVSFESVVAGLNFTCGLTTSNFSTICWGPGWNGSSIPGLELPLSKILPDPCVESSCSDCGIYPQSDILCSGNGNICRVCSPLPNSSPPSKALRRGLLSFKIVGEVGSLSGIFPLTYCLWAGICFGNKKIHNSVRPTIIQIQHDIWIKLPIEVVNFVEPAINEGFYFHHAEPKYLMLVYWILETSNTLPANASHRIGIAALVINDKRKVLVVQENNGRFRGSEVWKFPTGVVDEGEDICDSAVREVKEETEVIYKQNPSPDTFSRHDFSFAIVAVDEASYAESGTPKMVMFFSRLAKAAPIMIARSFLDQPKSGISSFHLPYGSVAAVSGGILYC